ncbi:hypothetical protein TRICI_001996, partial [Trichomonascus ciferrii]
MVFWGHVPRPPGLASLEAMDNVQFFLFDEASQSHGGAGGWPPAKLTQKWFSGGTPPDPQGSLRSRLWVVFEEASQSYGGAGGWPPANLTSSYDSEEHRASYSTGNTTPEHDHAAAADKSQQEQGQEGPDVALFVKTDCYTRKRPTATGLASIRTALTHNNHNNNNNNNGHHSSGASSSSASISSLPESPTSTVVVVNDRSRIQTPASASASVASSVEIGAQVPFAPSNPNPDRPTPLFKSHSELVLPTRATTGGTATRTATEQQRAYKPAQAIIASPTTTTTAGTGGAPAPAPQNDYSMNQFPYIGASEETRRYNYSVPSSPTSSGYTSPIPRQIKEPKTPLYVPA